MLWPRSVSAPWIVLQPVDELEAVRTVQGAATRR